MPNYEVELGTELHLPNLESWLATVGGSVLGVVLSTPYYDNAKIVAWRDGEYPRDAWADSTLDDRVAIALPSDADALTLSAKGFAQWVASLDPSATYTAGVPTWEFTIGAVGAVINIEFVRAGSVVLSETIASGETRALTVRHGDEGTVLQVTPEAGYTFDHWEFLQYILTNGQIVEDPETYTSTNNPHIPPGNKWVAYDMWRNVVAILSSPEPPPPPPPEEHVTPWSGTLPPGNYLITFPSSVTKDGDIYNFAQWEDGSTNPQRMVSVPETGSISIFAEYIPEALPTYTLTLDALTGGTTNPEPGSYPVTAGETVLVTALPDVDNRFVEWRLNGTVRTENPVNVTMDKDYSLLAVFEYVPPPPVTANISGVVQEAETGNPIPGATVTCDGYADVTEVDGSYEFIGIPAVVYTLDVQKNGYEPQTRQVDASTGGSFTETFEMAPPTPPV